MKNRVVILALTVFALAAHHNPAAATGPRAARFVAHLSGFEEVPALVTAGSGRAQFLVTAEKIRYRLKIESLEGPVRFTHIHIGQKGVNGGVSVFLCDNTGNPAAAAAPACPQSGVVTGTLTSADVLGPAAQGVEANDFDGLLEALLAGVTYVNVHSDKFPAGELRGQIQPR